MTRATLYRTSIQHRRAHPVSHDFTYRGYWWLIDVDHIAELPRGLRLRTQDYSGDPGRSIATNIRQFLNENGCDTTDTTITMLTTPRQLNHSFNPITVYYCRRADGTLVTQVAEVHNTYGGRHRYLLNPDGHHTSDTAKQLYVSPFFDVSGHYRIQAPLPDSRLYLTVVLRRDDEPPFIATVTGKRVPITARNIAAALVTGSPLMTSARIRYQGIRLWLRGLTVHPREKVSTANG